MFTEYLFIKALVAVAFICAGIGLYIGIQLFESADNRWRFCTDELPPDNGRIISNYPVAFFDDEFGVICDQAEYHPARPDKWLTVSEGTPCHPFAWYDLPAPPHPRIPQDVPSRNAIENYI